MTAGLRAPGPVDPPRQPPRRLGQRRGRPDQRHGRGAGRGARRGRAGEDAAGSRSAPSSTPPGTARSRACSAPPSGPRPTPTSCARKPSPTSTPTATRRGFLGVGGSHTLETLVNQVARDVTDPEKGISVADRAARRRRPLRRRPSGRRKLRDTRRPSASTPLGSGSDYTPFLQHLGIAVARHRLRRRGASTASTTRSTTPSTTTPASWTRTSHTASRWPRPAAGLVLRLADADVLPFEFDRFAEHHRPLRRTRSRSSRTTCARRPRSATAACDDKLYEAVDDPTQTWVAPEARWTPSRTSTSRRSRTPRRP